MEVAVSGVRLMVGTRKGAFILTSDGVRNDWKVNGPHFPGHEIFHLKGSPANPDTLYASQATEWFGQQIQRSNDGGETWHPVGSDFQFVGEVGDHLWYDGTSKPWEFKRIWHLEPSLSDPETVYAGAQDAALFRTSDGGNSWLELTGLRTHESAPQWSPGAAGMGLHTIIEDHVNTGRMYVAISAAGVFRSDDAGESWQVKNKNLTSNFLPDPTAEIGHCIHKLSIHPAKPDVIYMQKHWDVMRSDDAGDSWQRISGNLPTDFGMPVDVHAHEPETVYVVPLKSDSEHFPLDGKLIVYRSKVGGNEWEPLMDGLPQKDCYVNILRDAMAVDSLDECGIYFGTTGGQVYASPDGGDSWNAIVHDLPPVLSVEVQTLP